MLRRLLLPLSLLWGLLLGGPALACSCGNGHVDPQKYLYQASLVFEGEVLSLPLSDWVRNTATLRVLTQMKGRLGKEVTLDQSRSGNCTEVFEAGNRLRIVAYGNAEEGYWTSACALNYLWPELQGDEIWTLATANRRRTIELGGSDISATDAATLRRLIQWHADYGSFEEGLDAVERLLVLSPHDPDGLRFKEQFKSALKDTMRSLPVAE